MQTLAYATPAEHRHTFARHVLTDRDAAEQRLGQMITQGRARAAQVIESLMAEAQRRQDYLVPASQLQFVVSPVEVGVNLEGAGRLALADHALGEMRQDLRVSADFLKGLQKDGERGAQVATQLLNDLHYRLHSRRLLRVVGGQVKGWLSEDYNPIDQSEVITGFLAALQAVNAIPTGGFISDWRYSLDALYGEMFEALPGEYLVMGAQLRSSDYGAAAVTIALSFWRIICTNLAVGKALYRQVHIGKHAWQLDDGFKVSHQTMRLTAEASVSAMQDAIRQVFSRTTREKLVADYTRDAQTHIDADNAAKALRKKGVLTETDAHQVVNMVRGEDRIEILPHTEDPESALRFKQALAFIALQTQGDRRLLLQDAAMNLTA
jgi:hypothetical protein